MGSSAKCTTGTALDRAREDCAKTRCKSPIVMKIGSDAYMRAVDDADFPPSVVENAGRGLRFVSDERKIARKAENGSSKADAQN